jgi:hypothetical protein
VNPIDLTRTRILSNEPDSRVYVAEPARKPQVLAPMVTQFGVLGKHRVDAGCDLACVVGHAPAEDPMTSVTIRSVTASFDLSTTSDALSM